MTAEKCWRCSRNYLHDDDDEDVCVECAVMLSDENESFNKYSSDMLCESVTWDKMNDIGFSLTQRDWWDKK